LPDLLRNYSFPQGRTPITLIGPHYALLRDEFRTSPLAQPASIADKVLVSVGGTDPHFATAWVLNTLAKANPNLTVVVTFSKNSDHLAALKTLIDATPISVELHLDAPNMSELMLETRFTIGAAGSSCWERCALGVPSILFSVAPNQDRLVETISAQGGALAIQMFDTEALEVATQKLLYHDDSLLTMAAAAQVICDGKGVSRTVPAILNMLKPI
jgi:UDP-2,4-diacetamido-2,4,6-trideoxy-beta-L-altropyranose hydrolase